MRKYKLRMLSVCLCLIGLGPVVQAADKPNIIIIFTDDQGYGDLGCFGSEKIRTPHIDRMAAEGLKLTSFYVAANLCSPSRAALLTGCYPKRVGMEKHVVFPGHNWGLHPEELTLADMLKGHGYATACVGKWHLGHRKQLLPTAQGFDSYYGIPYSNDMNHPDNKGKPRIASDESWLNQDESVKKWKTPLMQNEEIIELPVNQRTITRRYTDKAIEFVKANQENPFFLYLPHSMPHIPLFVPEDAYDPDPANAYKAVIEHVDAETGRLMDTLRELKLEESTYVIFTSDNGPWLRFKNHGGSAGPLRAGKMSTYEGGHRVPCVVWGPGRIPAGGESDEFVTAMDILPTLAKLSGSKLTPRGNLDGMDVSGVLLKGEKSPRTEMLFYTARGEVQGIRQGDWKFVQKGLYNLADDIGEKKDLASGMPDKVAALKSRMTELNAEIAKNARPRGQFDPDKK